MRALALVIFAALAAPAAAETYGDAYGLGDHPAAPVQGGGLGDLVHVTAELLKADGSPADRVAAGEVVSVRLTVSRAADRPAVQLRLHCTLYFTNADNEDSPGTEGTCLDAKVGGGETVVLNVRLKFRGSAEDRPETYGVGVEVKDEISGEALSLMPTWTWEGAE